MNVYVLTLAGILLLVLALYAFACVCVYRDAQKRQINAVFWMLAVLLLPALIGVVIYLIVRPRQGDMKCARCGAVIMQQYTFCPQCGVKIHNTCPNCTLDVEPDWSVCPKCAQPLPAAQEDVCAPVMMKDHAFHGLLIALVALPIMIFIALAVVFTSSGSSGTAYAVWSGMTIEEYFAEEAVPESIKVQVEQWIQSTEVQEDYAYALQYDCQPETQLDSEPESTEYYYLIYVPNADTEEENLLCNTKWFSNALALELDCTGGDGALFCIGTDSSNGMPDLKVCIDEREVPVEIAFVDFNPALPILSEPEAGTILF